MLSDTMAASMNDQLNAEAYSAYLYWQMAAWLEDRNLPGMANWMKVQAQEEMNHASMFFSHILRRNKKVTLQTIQAPEKTEWASPLEVFEDALKHEEYITSRLNKMMDLATSESDHASISMLRWFIDEQVEEEENANSNVDNLKLVGDRVEAVLFLDKEMAARSFAAEPGPDGG